MENIIPFDAKITIGYIPILIQLGKENFVYVHADEMEFRYSYFQYVFTLY